MDGSTGAGLDGDLLNGAGEISKFLFGTTSDRRKVYHLAASGVLPCFNLGAHVCARKSVLLRWIAEQEAKGTTARAREAA